MTRFYITLEVLVRDLSRRQMEDLFEPLADSVYDLSDVIDADLAMDLGKRVFEFTMAVDEDGPSNALQVALNAARTALHCTGASTAGWEDLFEFVRQNIWHEPRDRDGRSLTTA
ncbi:hypothetical protein [Glycomyces arizonensis]|uniref:hypothetical protein n=1 Tax=Glycomyces arizonensis TaxID=256035 RepID=UPI00047CA5CB|nr:hypothetical protein [Glycomyces arizonensis]